MPPRVEALSLPHQDLVPSPSEDAMAWSLARGPAGIRLAVADGAGESAFAGLWARILVRAFAAGTWDGDPASTALATLQARWRRLVERRPLAWHQAEKVREGAFATFLGLTLRPHGRVWRWRARATGDACLVWAPAGSPARAFPQGNPPLRPQALGTRPAPPPPCTDMAGDARPGDAFLLLTDAVAAWYLGSPDRRLLRLLAIADAGPAAFCAWAAAERAQGRLRNDDLTLLSLRLEAG